MSEETNVELGADEQQFALRKFKKKLNEAKQFALKLSGEHMEAALSELSKTGTDLLITVNGVKSNEENSEKKAG